MSIEIRTEAHARKMKVISFGTTFMGNCAPSYTTLKDCIRYHVQLLAGMRVFTNSSMAFLREF